LRKVASMANPKRPPTELCCPSFPPSRSQLWRVRSRRRNAVLVCVKETSCLARSQRSSWRGSGERREKRAAPGIDRMRSPTPLRTPGVWSRHKTKPGLILRADGQQTVSRGGRLAVASLRPWQPSWAAPVSLSRLLRQTNRSDLCFSAASRSAALASSASSTDHTRNCSIISGSVAVFAKTRHLRACSRK
jgi:hypothetical protein